MSDRLGMMYAIHEQPDDDLPRLAYADWLEEHGEAEHAEFIRVELQLARLPRSAPGYRALFKRELELIRAHKDEWFGTARHDWGGYEVRRGFVEEICARSPASVMPHADWLFSHHALQDLSVNGPWAQLRSLLDHPLAGVLARLVLSGTEVRVAWYSTGTLTRNLPLSRRPLVLSLRGHRAGPEIVEDLLGSPHAGRVSWLSLDSNALTAAGVVRLLSGLEVMPRLKVLSLAGVAVETGPRSHSVRPNIDRDGVLALAGHPAAARLEEIDLSHNRIDREAVAALVRSPHLAGVKRLAVGHVSDRGDARRLRQHFGDRVELPSEQ